MKDKSDFYIEPMRLIASPEFLSGIIGNAEGCLLIDNKDDALNLLFSQHIPDSFAIWQDFFAGIISTFCLHPDYRQAEKDIQAGMVEKNADMDKDNIRKRKLQLMRRKQGLSAQTEYEFFLEEVSDECWYMLNMISIHRYLHPSKPNEQLEQMFSIFRQGLMPCGVTKEQKIVVFNPMKLKNAEN
ncbi:hypothetical protein KKI90_15005 [Xenorhabdus bovienii]|uniref:Uncharacterized protein n=1 Tax=Xenorhabdus bovienii TaxID=40576 RepID=A0AAJ1J949_XENBV|nr:hypothetical protein [Xenorhabdus bovienii]MDE1479249.1 hypothetical protein [Xenorhabdus bovienii]MDE1487621.1 hypothetical protein [Xenorhabdus bovienii]MDE1492160.1 hypothetical protein [Xenorhabdus bovienii]MDE1496516.1 hypothetical protein [Xenorhabdus bovienii]MDE9474528.1 hypothetical protein [Xenorhabdus bovienii]